jgi:hypothetical protein
MRPLRQSTADQIVVIGPIVDADGVPQTALTIANTDIRIWKSGTTAFVAKNSGGATHIEDGYYRITLDATDTSEIGELTIAWHLAGTLPDRKNCEVMQASVFDWLNGTGAGTIGSVTGAVGSVTGDVGGDVAGSVGSVASGGITAASLAADAITAAKVAADLIAEIQAGLSTLDAAGVRAALGLTTGNLDAQLAGLAPAPTTYTLAAGGTDTITLDADDATTGEGSIIVTTGGTGSGQMLRVTGLASGVASVVLYPGGGSPALMDVDTTYTSPSPSNVNVTTILGQAPTPGIAAEDVDAIVAAMAGVDVNVATILGVVPTPGVATADQQAIADATLVRGVANVDGSAEAGSLYTLIQALRKWSLTHTPGSFVVFRTDGTTPFETIPVTSAADAEAITEMGG